MRLLLIADINSIWTYNYALLLADKDIELTVWPIYKARNSFSSKLMNQGIGVLAFSDTSYSYFERNKHSFFEKIRFLWCIILDSYNALKNNSFDLINIQYVDPNYMRLFLLFPWTFKKMVLSYWGSDLLRAKKKDLLQIRRIINRCRGCTFDNEDLYCEHIRVYGKKVNREVVMLPLPILDVIDRNRDALSSDNITIAGQVVCREKTCVCVGYCGRRQQQHIEAIKQLGKINPDIKNNILILLPMTYSIDANDSYITEVKQAVTDSGIEYVMFEEFMTDEEVAKLRLVTDVFIHAQTTDAFSGSICEILYAGGVLVNAKWLHYKEFDKYPITFREFEEFDELAPIIESLVQERRVRSGDNRRIIKSLRSVDNCRNAWVNYYNRIVRKDVN